MTKTGDQLGIAIIGCGAIAWANAEAIQAVENARLAYAVDVNPESAGRLGKKYGIPSGTDFEVALNDKSVDSVFICTPHFQHAPLAEAAARAGKHVIVEKPMGATLQDSRLIVDACREAGVQLSVCYCMRYSRKIKFIKEFIAAGGIGEIIGFEIVMLRDRSEDYLKMDTWQEGSPHWHGVREKSGGGTFINNISHYLDYYFYLTGLAARDVYANSGTFRLPADIEDYLTAQITLDNGAFGVVEAGNSVPGAGRGDDPGISNSRQRLWGKSGQVILVPELKIFSRKRVHGWKPDQWHRLKPSKLYNSPGTGLEERREFIEKFACSVREGRQPDVSGEEASRVMAVIDAAYRSAECGQPVKVE